MLGALRGVPKDFGGSRGGGNFDAAQGNAIDFDVAIAPRNEDVEVGGEGSFDNFTQFVDVILQLALLRGFVGPDVKGGGGTIVESLEAKVLGGTTTRGGGGKGLKVLGGAERGTTQVTLELNGELLAKGGALQGEKGGETREVGGEGRMHGFLGDGAGVVNTCNSMVGLAVPGGIGEGLGGVEHSVTSSEARVELGATSFEAGNPKLVGVALGAAGSDSEFDFIKARVISILSML